jgi:hypothetical protein
MELWHRAVTESELEAQFQQLVEALPELKDIDALLDSLGLPPKAVVALRAFLAGSEGAAGTGAKQWLLSKLDPRGWQELREAFALIRHERQLPRLSIVLREGSGWNRAALAVLGCPQVQFSTMQLLGMRALGLKVHAHRQKRCRFPPSPPPPPLSAGPGSALDRSTKAPPVSTSPSWVGRTATQSAVRRTGSAGTGLSGA